MALEKRHIKVVAVGFLETLVDVELGMRQTLERLIGGGRVDLEAMAAAWRTNLRARYAGPYSPWPQHLLDALYQEAKRFRIALPAYEEEVAQDWVPRWPFLPDYTALARLGRRYDLALVSELDAETLAACYPNLPRQPDRTATSDMARVYMPHPGFFKLWRVQLRFEEPEQLLVVSRQRAIELEPAAALGHQTLHLDGSGAEPGSRDLHDVAALLG